MTGFKFFAAKHGDGALIVGRKVLAIGDGGAELDHCGSFKDGSDRLPDHDAGIFCVPEIVGGSVWMKADSSSQLK